MKGTKYPIKSGTFHITTESVTGGNDVVVIYLYEDDGGQITYIKWMFSDWGYIIIGCTRGNFSLKFPALPPTGIKKTWELTFTTEYVRIMCNTLEVLYFILNNTHSSTCKSNVKGKTATKVAFHKDDTATKMFTSDFAGK